MMRLSTLWKVDSTVDASGSSPVAERILQNWEPDAGSMRFFRSSANFLYVFQTDGIRYFLRFADSAERSRVAIEAEVDLVNWLATAGIQVALPIRASNGQFVTTTEMEWGTFHAVVFSELHGTQFELGDLDETQFRKWGAALGTLHAALKAYPGRASLNRRSWKDDLEQARNYVPPDSPAMLSEWEQLAQALSALPVDRDRYGLIHFDFEPDNLLWNVDRIAILDFDDCAHYWFAADIAFALRDLFVDSADLGNGSFREFIQGYSAICPLDEAAIAQVPLFLRLSKLIQYVRLARSLDLAEDGTYPDWLEALQGKLRSRMADYRLSLEGRRQ
jgi:Ser/Thr protein kinase RdoA (MazF antagonist)